MRSFLVAVVVALGLLCASFAGFATTPRGVQCPTAPVQTVPVRDCCGRIVARAPKLGERAFVQCRCAEKKGATQVAVVGGKVTLFLERGAPLEFALSPRVLSSVPAFAAAFVSVSPAPPTPPPA